MSYSPMDHALELARSVSGTTSPNPAVGCVILKDGRLVGKGATQPPGGPHAEIGALNLAGKEANGADIYVTLEPCAHAGRTPPCVDSIISAGPATVHVAVRDPNPSVSGNGIEQLRNAGINIIEGERKREAQRLNEAFMKWIVEKRPFVYVKFAMSLDGKIATFSGDSKWITGQKSRAEVHRLRSIVDAVMIGSNTARTDDPKLTARAASGKPKSRQPLRIVVDTKASTPIDSQMFREPGPSLVATTSAASEDAIKNLMSVGAGIEVVRGLENGVDLDSLLQKLGEKEITSILVEGGSIMIGSLLDARLVDKIVAFVAPVVIGGAGAPSPAAGVGTSHITDALRLNDVETHQFGDDTMISGYPIKH